MLFQAKSRAKAKHVLFTITEKDIIIPEFCPILGIRLIKRRSKSGDNSPSLDRIVPSLGYVPGNVAVISQRANRLKGDGTIEEHRAIASFIENAAKGIL